MRRWKTRISRVLAATIAAVQIFGTALPARAAEENVQTQGQTSQSQIHYVAFGDSITDGDHTYVNMVGSYLKTQYGQCEVTNLGVDGMQSKDLKEVLVNSSNPWHAIAVAQLSDADIVTLDIGSNDILVTAYEVMADCFGCSVDQLGSVISGWSERLSSQNFWVRMKAYMEALPIAYSLHNELYNGKKMKQAVSSYESNYAAILEAIKQMAPGASIYVGNLYNPFHNTPSTYIGSYEVLNMETVSKQYVLQLNAIIDRQSAGCTVVDLYNTINDNKYLLGDPDNYDYNPHPNQTGHRAIADKFIAAMK